MTGQEFGLHWADYHREPWGDLRVDIAGAVVARTLAEVNRDREKQPQPFDLADFMPLLPREDESPQGPASAQDMFDMMNGVSQ